jgi:LPS sulfotransferase NodH
MSLDFIKDIDKSVVILSTPRTGSTALCRVLSDKCNLLYCNEVFHLDVNPAHIKSFWHYFNNNVKTAIKIFPNHHSQFTEDEFDKIINNSFVIFLERLDIAQQITSYHILSRTNKASYGKNEKTKDYLVDEDEISVSVSNILKLREDAEKYRKLANITLCYEDIINDIVNDHIKEYHKPVNYSSLKLKVDEVLSNFLKLKQKHERSTC